MEKGKKERRFRTDDICYATAQTCICTAAFVPNTPNMKMLAAGRYFGKEMTRKQTETEWLGYTVGRNISYVDV